MNYAIGIDLGGSSIKAVTATPAGEALSRHNIDFDPDKNMEWAEKIRALVQQLQK
jgi:predicted NBD/HSP70 family sugar kinase